MPHPTTTSGALSEGVSFACCLFVLSLSRSAGSSPWTAVLQPSSPSSPRDLVSKRLPVLEHEDHASELLDVRERIPTPGDEIGKRPSAITPTFPTRGQYQALPPAPGMRTKEVLLIKAYGSFDCLGRPNSSASARTSITLL